MNLFSQIIIILVLIIIVLVLWRTFKKMSDSTKTSTKNLNKKSEEEGKTVPLKKDDKEEVDNSGETTAMPFHKINVYNFDGSIYCTKSISEIKELGFTIGRSNDNDLVIDLTDNVGRHHATIKYSNNKNRYYIKDEDSKSGTYDVNQKPVEVLELQDGVVFYIANVKCSFEKMDPFKGNDADDTKNETKSFQMKPKEEDEFIGTIYKL